jgi:hypothetical protein
LVSANHHRSPPPVAYGNQARKKCTLKAIILELPISTIGETALVGNLPSRSKVVRGLEFSHSSLGDRWCLCGLGFRRRGVCSRIAKTEFAPRSDRDRHSRKTVFGSTQNRVQANRRYYNGKSKLRLEDTSDCEARTFSDRNAGTIGAWGMLVIRTFGSHPSGIGESRVAFQSWRMPAHRTRPLQMSRC